MQQLTANSLWASRITRRSLFEPLLGRMTPSIPITQLSPQIVRRAFLHASRTLNSSSTVTAPLSEHPPKPPSGVSKEPARPSRRRRYVMLSIAIFLSLGFVSGRTVSLILIPPPLPESGSAEDGIYLKGLEVEADQLPMVQELRAHPEEWRELEPHTRTADSEQLAIEQPVSDSTGRNQWQVSSLISSIKGSFGIGYYRVFWNAKEHRAITVVHLGVSLSGWPSIVHGGALATLLQENMESFVQLMRETALEPAKRASATQSSSTRSLQLRYRRPTHAQRFYVIRTEYDSSSQSNQSALRSHIEDARSGLITVEATGETSP